ARGAVRTGAASWACPRRWSCTEEDALMIIATPTPSRPEVRISAGKARGSWEGSVAVFRGLPFAERPVGALRFGAPRRVRGWDGLREAVSFGPSPPQAA